MPSFCISSKLFTSDFEDSSFVLKDSQLKTSQLMKSFCEQATEIAPLCGMMLGNLAAPFVRFQSSRLLGQVLGKEGFFNSISHISSWICGVTAEGFLMTATPGLMRKEALDAGLWRGTTHATLTMMVCEGISKRIPLRGGVLGACSQDLGVMLVNWGCGELNISEKAAGGFVDQLVEARVMSMRIGVSSCLVKGMCVDVSLSRGKYELNHQLENLAGSGVRSSVLRKFSPCESAEEFVTNNGVRMKGEIIRLQGDSIQEKTAGLFMAAMQGVDGLSNSRRTIVEEKLNRSFQFVAEVKLPLFEEFRKIVVGHLDQSHLSGKIMKAIRADFRVVDEAQTSEEVFHVALTRLEKVAHHYGIVQRFGSIQNGRRSLFARSVAYIYEGKVSLEKERALHVATKAHSIKYTSQTENLYEEAKTSEVVCTELWNFQFLDLVDRLEGVVVRFGGVEELLKPFFDEQIPLDSAPLDQAVELLREQGRVEKPLETIHVIFPYKEIGFAGQSATGNLKENLLLPTEAALKNAIRLVDSRDRFLEFRMATPPLFEALLSIVNRENNFRAVHLFGDQAELPENEVISLLKRGETPEGIAKDYIFLGDIAGFTHPWFFRFHDHPYHAAQRSHFPKSMAHYYLDHYEHLRNDAEFRAKWPDSNQYPRYVKAYFARLIDGHTGNKKRESPSDEYVFYLLQPLDPFSPEGRYQEAAISKEHLDNYVKYAAFVRGYQGAFVPPQLQGECYGGALRFKEIEAIMQPQVKALEDHLWFLNFVRRKLEATSSQPEFSKWYEEHRAWLEHFSGRFLVRNRVPELIFRLSRYIQEQIR